VIYFSAATHRPKPKLCS